MAFWRPVHVIVVGIVQDRPSGGPQLGRGPSRERALDPEGLCVGRRLAFTLSLFLIPVRGWEGEQSPNRVHNGVTASPQSAQVVHRSPHGRNILILEFATNKP